MLTLKCLDKYRDKLPNFAFNNPPRPSCKWFHLIEDLPKAMKMIIIPSKMYAFPLSRSFLSVV